MTRILYKNRAGAVNSRKQKTAAGCLSVKFETCIATCRVFCWTVQDNADRNGLMLSGSVLRLRCAKHEQCTEIFLHRSQS